MTWLTLWTVDVEEVPIGLDYSSVGSQERHAFCAVATNLFSAWCSRFAVMASAHRVWVLRHLEPK